MKKRPYLGTLLAIGGILMFIEGGRGDAAGLAILGLAAFVLGLIALVTGRVRD